MASDQTAWSRGRWWGMILTAFAAQVLLVLFLGERTPVVSRRAGADSSFTLIANPPSGSPVAESLALGDPTLFALPDPRGFSGGAWLRQQPVERPSFSWSEPDRWLTQSVADLGASLEGFTRQNRLRYRTCDEKPMPVVTHVDAPPVPFPARSTVGAEGPRDRPLVAMPEVPSVPSADVLADTVVQVGIAPSGFALSAVVLSGSGSATADQLALDAARSSRFKPLPLRNPLAVAWARLTFRWHTVAPPATNAVPPGASP